MPPGTVVNGALNSPTTEGCCPQCTNEPRTTASSAQASMPWLARASPVERSSGSRQYRRLNRGGDRQANAALHRIVQTRLRFDPRTRDYYERRIKEGKTRREIVRCLIGEVSMLRPRSSQPRHRTCPCCWWRCPTCRTVSPFSLGRRRRGLPVRWRKAKATEKSSMSERRTGGASTSPSPLELARRIFWWWRPAWPRCRGVCGWPGSHGQNWMGRLVELTGPNSVRSVRTCPGRGPGRVSHDTLGPGRHRWRQREVAPC